MATRNIPVNNSVTAVKLAFIIDMSIGGESLRAPWLLIQAVAAPAGAREETFLYNQVQRHLDGLHRRSGLDYEIIWCGPPSGVGDYLRHERLTLF